LWQIKKHTLAGFLVLWVLKMALTIGKLQHLKAIFRTYKSNALRQAQDKLNYRFKHKVAKNSDCESS